jgi:hypothetical protein
MDDLEIMQRHECEQAQVRLDEFDRIGQRLLIVYIGYSYNAVGECRTSAR